MNCEQHETPKKWGRKFEEQAQHHHRAAVMWGICLAVVAVVGGTFWWVELLIPLTKKPTTVMSTSPSQIPNKGEAEKPSSGGETTSANEKKSPESAGDSFASSTPSTLSVSSTLSVLSTLSASEGTSSAFRQDLHVDAVLWINLAEKILNRLALFLIFGVMLFFLVKNCLAHWHNQIVNRHRANALLVCQQLAHEAKKREGNSCILRRAADHVWNTDESGFIQGTKDVKGGGVSVNLSGFSGGTRTD